MAGCGLHLLALLNNKMIRFIKLTGRPHIFGMWQHNAKRPGAMVMVVMVVVSFVFEINFTFVNHNCK